MRDNTILWAAAIIGGGYVLYKSGILGGLAGTASIAGAAIDTAGTITGQVGAGLNSVAQVAQAAQPAVAAASGIAPVNEYYYSTSQVAQAANLNPNHPLSASVLGLLGSQLTFGLYGSSMQFSANDAYNYISKGISSIFHVGGSQNITGTPTAQLPDKATTPQQKQSPGAAQSMRTGGGFATNVSKSSTPVVTKTISGAPLSEVSYIPSQLTNKYGGTGLSLPSRF